MSTDDAIARLKAGARASWSENPYGPLAERLNPAAVELVRACGVGPGMRVLDVAAGTGNAAVEAVRAGADVVASDFAPGQVRQGRERTAAEGLDIEWVEADAEELPFEDGSFDATLSVFGAMFAPRPDHVARELFRVVRPGGIVGMANWPAEGFQAGFFQIMNKYRDQEPVDVPQPSLWGAADVVRERFAPYADDVSVTRSALPWRFGSPEDMVVFLRDHGPRQSLVAEERREPMLVELLELIRQHNQADDGSLAIDAVYSVVVARKRS